MFPVILTTGSAAGLNKVVQLVEQLLGGAVDLCVGLAHVLVERLVRVDGALQVGDVRPRGGRAQVAAAAPLGHVFDVLEKKL